MPCAVQAEKLIGELSAAHPIYLFLPGFILNAVVLEILKYGVVLSIAIWLSIAQVLTWKRRDRALHS
jgi:hypothetical protein